MRKIKDRILLGALSGTIASVAGRILNKFNFKKGLTDIRYNPMAAQLFLSKKKSKSPQGVFLGSIVNNINTAVNGIGLTYFLSATGKDHLLLKGMGAGAFSWILIDGIMGSRVLKIRSGKPFAPTVRLGEHLVYGMLCAALITQLGDESLFPQKSKKNMERNSLKAAPSPNSFFNGPSFLHNEDPVLKNGHYFVDFE
jgi:hypothetical protein